MSQTIVAQATANGLAGLSVIRVSGKDAFKISDKCFVGKKKITDAKSHTILYGKFISPINNIVIDDVTVSIFKAPNSYTGENVVEFGSHGGTIIPMQIVQNLLEAGCRVAEPGEFTQRAFMNGRINLVQAEAIADIIHAISVPSANISERQLQGGITRQLSDIRNKLLEIASLLELELDFADEDIPLISNNNILHILSDTAKLCDNLTNSFQAANILRDGFYIAIVGKPNAGKSTLFNTILNQQRSIVSDIPGTTRDYISEYIYLNNLPIKIIDTAGLREAKDNIEIEGIKFAHNNLKQTNLILLVNDINEGKNNSDELYNELKKNYGNAEILLIQNKIDGRSPIYNLANSNDEISIIYISAKEGNGIDEVKKHIIKIAEKNINNSNDILLNERQYYKLLEVSRAINNAIILLQNNEIAEIVSIEIRNAGQLLGELTGETWNEKVLNNIFSKFCIGK